MKRLAISFHLLLSMTLPFCAKHQAAKPSGAELIATELDEHGLDSALAVFSVIRENPDRYILNEEEFCALGVRLLEENRTEAAVAVLSQTTELYPNSLPAYFNLAAACIYEGDKEGSIVSLQAALEINPRFFIAEFVLDDIDNRLRRVALERERAYEPGGQTVLKGPYLGQEPPGLVPTIFAPGLVSEALALNFSCTFSPEGREFYFNRFMTIMVCRLLDSGWTAPEPVTFTDDIRAHEPHITLDGQRLYFGWFQPAPKGFQKQELDYGIYVCRRTAEGWSRPEYVGYGNFVTSTRNGEVYVAERRKSPYSQIRQAILEDGIFREFVHLGGGLADIEERFHRTSHPSISPDGRTILFDSSMRSGLFAAFRDDSGVWSKPIELSKYGLSDEAGIANYSPDGKYIFFQDAGDIYWISSQFVENLRPDKR